MVYGVSVQTRIIWASSSLSALGDSSARIRRSDLLPERWKRPYGDHRKGRESV